MRTIKEQEKILGLLGKLIKNNNPVSNSVEENEKWIEKLVREFIEKRNEIKNKKKDLFDDFLYLRSRSLTGKVGYVDIITNCNSSDPFYLITYNQPVMVVGVEYNYLITDNICNVLNNVTNDNMIYVKYLHMTSDKEVNSYVLFSDLYILLNSDYEDAKTIFKVILEYNF